MLSETRFNGFAFGNYVYPDGMLLMAGNSYFNSNQDIIFSKYNPNGSPKLSFGTAGFKHLDWGRNEELRSMIVQQDGKILVAGYFANVNTPDSAFLIRCLNSGEPDSSFGVNGIVISNAAAFYDAKLLPDGRIMVCGNSNGGFLSRYTASGAMDQSFADNGIFITSFNADNRAAGIALQDYEKILISGTTGNNLVPEGDYFLTRLSSNGHFDSSFGIDGKMTYPAYGAAYAMATHDSNIYLSGSAGENPMFTTMVLRNNGMPSSPYLYNYAREHLPLHCLQILRQALTSGRFHLTILLFKISQTTLFTRASIMQCYLSTT